MDDRDGPADEPADARRHAPATLRNRDPLLGVLRQTLPVAGRVLEVASGTGEHAIYFATALPALQFQPTDPNAEAVASMDAWRIHSGVANVLPALPLDVRERPWPIRAADALLCINMIHISPWPCTEALFAGAADLLPAGAPLVTYGPYRRQGRHTAPSNAAFDEDLRQRDPRFGVRDLEAVIEVASAAGFTLPQVHELPANNLALCFYRRATT